MARSTSGPPGPIRRGDAQAMTHDRSADTGITATQASGRKVHSYASPARPDHCAHVQRAGVPAHPRRHGADPLGDARAGTVGPDDQPRRRWSATRRPPRRCAPRPPARPARAGRSPWSRGARPRRRRRRVLDQQRLEHGPARGAEHVDAVRGLDADHLLLVVAVAEDRPPDGAVPAARTLSSRPQRASSSAAPRSASATSRSGRRSGRSGAGATCSSRGGRGASRWPRRPGGRRRPPRRRRRPVARVEVRRSWDMGDSGSVGAARDERPWGDGTDGAFAVPSCRLPARRRPGKVSERPSARDAARPRPDAARRARSAGSTLTRSPRPVRSREARRADRSAWGDDDDRDHAARPLRGDGRRCAGRRGRLDAPPRRGAGQGPRPGARPAAAPRAGHRPGLARRHARRGGAEAAQGGPLRPAGPRRAGRGRAAGRPGRARAPAPTSTVDVVRFEELARRALADEDVAAARAALALVPRRAAARRTATRSGPRSVASSSACATSTCCASTGAGRRVVELDAGDEARPPRPMRRHAANGDRHAALRQFERLDRALRRELGVAPGREARGAARPPARRRTTSRPRRRRRAGRARPRAGRRRAGAARRRRPGASRTLIVSGPAGIGQVVAARRASPRGPGSWASASGTGRRRRSRGRGRTRRSSRRSPTSAAATRRCSTAWPTSTARRSTGPSPARRPSWTGRQLAPAAVRRRGRAGPARRRPRTACCSPSTTSTTPTTPACACCTTSPGRRATSGCASCSPTGRRR